MMKKLIALFLAGLLPISISWAADTEKMTRDSREAIKMLGGELKATLQASIKANGAPPATGPQACTSARRIVGHGCQSAHNG